MRKILPIAFLLSSFLSNAQTTKQFGNNSYVLPNTKPVERKDQQENGYSLFYTEILKDSVYVIREQYEMENDLPIQTASWIEHFALKNLEYTYTLSPVQSDYAEGHSETWSFSISAKTTAGKTAYANGIKWMIYPPDMPAYRESLGVGVLTIYFSKRKNAIDFHETISALLEEE